MSETRTQGAEYLGRRGALSFRSAFVFGDDVFALDEAGRMWQSVWAERLGKLRIEGWRPVEMDVWEEEYVDS